VLSVSWISFQGTSVVNEDSGGTAPFFAELEGQNLGQFFS